MKSPSYLKFRRAVVWMLALGWFSAAGPATAQIANSAWTRADVRSTGVVLAQKSGAIENAPAAEETAVPPDKAAITGVRFLSWKSYTRVMLELSRGAKYEVRRLNEDSAKGLPARVYIDIKGARVGAASKDPIPVDDGLLRQMRIGQYSQDVVRVVLDMNNLGSHNAFVLPDPYRLVIDIYGQKGIPNGTSKAAPSRSDAPPRRAALRGAKPPPAVPAINGLRKIVLDPGHGGKDPGAMGPGAIAEKDIVLSIAKKLARKLTTEMGVQVVLTRNDDRYVALEDRTATANAEDADLFISLHMNASPNTEAKGVETYYLDNTTDEAAIRLAARENGTSRRNISDLQFILSDMTQNMKLEDSITLAHRLQGSMVGGMTQVMSDVKDLGVKKALFYVLVGARMPSVLVEMFFITHRSEGRAMSRGSYQDAMVEALYEGIEKFGQSNLMVKTL
ncbi:MAG: N-acetylmuramoyl-L-alanine amidase [Candidatus Binatia bacterium]